ncbi:TlyA family RNA methyltransferase [Siculibacillus lacustris]|uniref:TlyA family RNA methyltransferase n=1 Tax=Siculibacillus lacustris TaxID=1549641 RepID=A0A4Q9VHA6_9HYPH|nr:TlyA family RNA methyltransferase [Siculibacillus lacustris]TBW34498.1 TlyA family RNA methyltransferase [Siculibacillus lacustris]
MTRERLDVALVRLGLSPSRARAADAIRRGEVRLGGAVAAKPGQMVALDAAVEVVDPAAAWVSRSALKLIAALDAFALSPEGRRCLDVGASTGGFTEVLLARGATHVTAIDVGHGQLVEAIAADPRVTSIEGLNARDLTPDDLDGAPEFVVVDVSFISLALALPPALALAAPGAIAVMLVKPQFEVGREHVGKGGIVRDAEVAATAIDKVAAVVAEAGWQEIGRIPAPIRGGDGNQEHLLAARKPTDAREPAERTPRHDA